MKSSMKVQLNKRDYNLDNWDKAIKKIINAKIKFSK